VVVALALGAVNGGREWLASMGDIAAYLGLAWIALGVAAFLLVVLFWTWLWWRRAWFRLADGSLQLAKGLIFRQRRHVPLDRVQTVDTIRPLLARIFGLVKLKVESAGGPGSNIELAYLKSADAVRWRHTILSLAAAARREHPPAPGPAPPTAPPPLGITQPPGAATATDAIPVPGSAQGPTPGATTPGPPGQEPLTAPDRMVTGLAASPTGVVAWAADAGAAAGAMPIPGPGPGALPGAVHGPVAAPVAPPHDTAGQGAAPGNGPSAHQAAPAAPYGPSKSAETRIGELLGDDDAAAPELFAVPTGRLIGSILLSVGTWGAVAYTAGAVTPALAAGSPQVALGLLPALFGLLVPVWRRFTGGFGFSAKQTPRGLTLSHGLTTRVSQTIPPGRILAVKLSQGFLWRRLAWWRATMNVAGYSLESDQQTNPVLVPVAKEDTIRRAVWAVAPGLAQPGVWEAVTSAMTGKGTTPGFVTAPRRSRLLDPLTWRRNAFAVTDEALILRSGVLIRKVILVPHARIQSIGVSQGPLQRRFDLAAVFFHSAPGLVAPGIDPLATADAAALARGETDRLLAAMDRAVTATPTPPPPAAAPDVLPNHPRGEGMPLD
jgi:putative membrane protein